MSTNPQVENLFRILSYDITKRLSVASSFTAIDQAMTRLASGCRSPRTSVVSAKFESGTYDMNDESHTDQSYSDSPIASVGHSGDVAASLPQTSEISETRSNESTNNFSLSKDATETIKVSWSNSEGSTFDSVSDHFGCGDTRTDFGYVAFDHVDQNVNAVDACTSRRTSSSDFPPRLQNVDYFSEVQIASSFSDDVSVVEFISKEATRSIFERRMVPLDVSARRKRLDDVSAFSSTKSASPPDGSYSNPPILNRSTTGFGTDDHQLKTTFFGLPRTAESSPFEPNGVPKRISGKILNEDNKPKRMLEVFVKHRFDTLSTLGSISARSESFGNFSLSYEDDGSCKVSRKKIQRNACNTGNHHKSEENIEFGLVTRTTNKRIKDLKERLRKLQEVSDLQPQLGHIESSRQIQQKKTSAVRIQQVAKEAKTRPSHAKISPQAPAYRADAVSTEVSPELESNNDDISTIACELYREERQQKKASAVRIQQVAKEAKTRPSNAKIFPQAPAYRANAVPTVVSPELESNNDDISTIACELHCEERKCNLYDVELGVQNGPHLERSGLSRSTLCLQEFKYKISRVIRIGTEKAALATAKLSNSLEQFQIYQVMQRRWRMHMQERPPTEKAIIAVISLSCLVLFILLLSIVAK